MPSVLCKARPALPQRLGLVPCRHIRRAVRTWRHVQALPSFQPAGLARTVPRGGGHRRLESSLFQAAVVVSLGCILGIGERFTHESRRFQDVVGGDSHELVWLSDRGPFSPLHNRAFATLPSALCLASSAVAAFVTLRYPGRVRSVKLAPYIHQMFAVPVSLMLCFRFDNSYTRWWLGRREIENVAINIEQLAALSTNNMDVPTDGWPLQARRRDGWTNQVRLLSLLDTLCHVAITEVRRGEPHPLSRMEAWFPATAKLSPRDAVDCRECDNDLLWCVDRVAGCIHAGQAAGAFSAELSSQMYAILGEIVRGLRVCSMIRVQSTPAPFIIHMRTLLLAFCFTFPFTIIGTVGPVSVVGISGCVSFGLLGIEFCSREMEHPFGDDESDIPVQQVLGRARDSVGVFAQMHAKKLQ